MVGHVRIVVSHDDAVATQKNRNQSEPEHLDVVISELNMDDGSRSQPPLGPRSHTYPRPSLGTTSG
jgi:hypothetical protein